MSNQSNKTFYVYTLARPDGRVFYVGKGTELRIEHHEAHARLGKSGKLYDTIRQVWASGGQVVKTKVYHTDDEQAAFAEERRLIARYGQENLTNIKSGVRPRANIGLRKKHVGRPTVYQSPMAQICTRLLPKYITQMKQEAKERGVEYSQVVRESIVRGMEIMRQEKAQRQAEEK